MCAVNSFISDEIKPHDAANGNDYHSNKRYQVVMDNFLAHIKGDFIETTE